MGVQGLTPLDNILQHVQERQHFLLQGGAGSGKTETLKQVVQALFAANPSLRIACITHTNKAADEIKDRVAAGVDVSTIHSFLSAVIKPYSRNIKRVFPQLFLLPRFETLSPGGYDGDEKERKKEEHERFKKAHKTLSDRRKIILKEPTEKVVGKPAFDKGPDLYIGQLNELIDTINVKISEEVEAMDPSGFFYNETIFNNFFDPSYGHDGLLDISALLFQKYPLLGKILVDRYDCIFIDEYQDTNSGIIQALLQTLPNQQIVIGLFGDSEQAIYQDGIGSAREYIETGTLALVEKEDNYRCSPQVINVANQFRTDGLKQKVSLKKMQDGTFEAAEDRNGRAIFCYAVASDDDFVNTDTDKIVDRRMVRDALVKAVAAEFPDHVQLKLTNKSIAQDVGFGNLYGVFDDRYRDPRDRISSTLDKLQLGEVFELIELHELLTHDRRAYNRLISKLRNKHFTIKSVADKRKLQQHISTLTTQDRGAYKTVEYAIQHGLIRRSDSHAAFLERRLATLERLENDALFRDFEALHSGGANTLVRMKKALADSNIEKLSAAVLDESFDTMERDLKEKRFLQGLFSPDLPFSEVVAYYRYENDDSTFATMHKTKGTGIENVMAVLDEYNWWQYNFLSCFSGTPPTTSVEESTRKLLYVACSRAKKNLVCVRLVKDTEEAEKISAFFPEKKEIQIDTLMQKIC
ncbi:ATP-dependent helicase [Roseovarius sp. D22-M7]|uniref:ATP-dependent helicase n=1 Tax=Roseovarius sp. D22-M7 TaxID=3127116 RepID=UPI0030103A3A